jgi:hypothetical protein
MRHGESVNARGCGARLQARAAAVRAAAREQATCAALFSLIACLLAWESAFAQSASKTAGERIRLVAQTTPSGRPLHQDALLERVYEAKSLREAQAAERIRHQDAMEQIWAFQKRARERYNGDIKWCRDKMTGDEAQCMKAAAARHRQASGESQRLHRREMDLYNHNLAGIQRVWAPESRGGADMEALQHDGERLDASSQSDAQSWARAEVRAAEAERRALHERDQQEKQRVLEQQRAYERAQRQARQP